jgi:catechol 2,3-dioxygenase-like lactoylglutathione lyase family enzyme/ketosteroid isomerase-like protein
MNTMSDSPEIEILHRAWEALDVGDFTVLQTALAHDAKWRTVDEGPTNCEGRATIIEVMSRNLQGRLRGSIEEMIQVGSRVIVAFGPEQPSDTENRPLDDGIAYMVLTIGDGKIIELKGCADRAAAVTYARTDPTPGNPHTDGPRPPETAADPPVHRVSRLVPFVHVDDVERSIAFYHHLGFTVQSIYNYRERPVWADLHSDGAELMVTLDGEQIDPAGQGVLFYLYSHDLTALRDQLLTAGIQAGEIEDGTPGPRQEMRLTDPDGYVLMLAQIEPQTTEGQGPDSLTRREGS